MNLPTVDIKGKQYVLVKDRILAFNEKFADASITTELLSKPEDKIVVVKATVSYKTVDGFRTTFTGHSQATIGDGYINKTSALENAETSAVGRALAMMGIGVIDSIASVDEMNKAIGAEKTHASGNIAPQNPINEEQDFWDGLQEPFGEPKETNTAVPGSVVPNFPECPHPNFKGSSYRKCYACNLRK